MIQLSRRVPSVVKCEIDGCSRRFALRDLGRHEFRSLSRARKAIPENANTENESGVGERATDKAARQHLALACGGRSCENNLVSRELQYAQKACRNFTQPLAVFVVSRRPKFSSYNLFQNLVFFPETSNILTQCAVSKRPHALLMLMFGQTSMMLIIVKALLVFTPTVGGAYLTLL